MRKLLSLFVFVLTISFSKGQVQEVWAVSHLGQLQDQVVDANGNVYLTGRGYSAALDLEGNLTIKHDKNGNEIWRHFTPNFVAATSMAVDASGNVYVAGATGFQYMEHSLVEIEVDPTTHFYVIKINANGVFQWSNTYLEDDYGVYGYARKIAVDPSGIPYATGVIYLEFVNPEDPRIRYPDSTTADFTTIRYDAATGNRVWVKRYNGATPGIGFDEAKGIVTDPFGNIYVTGTSQFNGEYDIATIKYNPAGNQTWVQRFINPNSNYNNEFARDVKLDAAGNIIVGGYAHPIVGISSKLLLIKYTFSGFQLWAREPFMNVFVGALVSYGNVPFVIDNANNIIDRGSGPGIVGGLVKYNATGDVQWIVDQPAEDLAVDGNNNIYAVLSSNLGVRTRKLSSTGTELWVKNYSWPFSAESWIGVDADNNVYSSAGHYAYEGSTYVAIRYSQCEIVCPNNITVNVAPGTCGAVVTYAAATTSGACGSEITYSHASGSTFLVGTTTVTVRSTETGAECSFTITVNDNEPPVITGCPASQTVNTNTGVCYATVTAGTATASDNCNYTVVGTRSDGLALTANYPIGNTTITWTATDGSNNTATCTQIITVVDNVPPTITGESASVYVLSPPNHTMRDVTINYTATDNCSVTSALSVTSNEPVNGVSDGDTDPDWIIVDDHHVQLRAERAANGEGRIYTVTITAVDPSGNTTTKTVEIRVPHNIKRPHSGQAFKIGSTASFLGEFWDKPGNRHTAKWLVDGSTTVKATVTEPSGNRNGTVTGSYKFNTPGVYKLQMNVTDQQGITHSTTMAGDLDAIVVIYDPNGGHTYGGGYFESPRGALAGSPGATGKASYGFAMNYFKTSTYPKGETQFDFKVGTFEFNALNFDYLVINNSMAQFKGTGKIIGGQSGIGFTMTVVDGQLDGTGVDKIRMKIYNKTTGAIIYDNQPGASDAALPVQAIGSNSTVVINGTNSNLITTNIYERPQMEESVREVSTELAVVAYPNPSTHGFSVMVKAGLAEKVKMEVVDVYGRLIESRQVNANSITKFGDRYRSGIYFVKIIHGKQSKEIKLVKLAN